MNRSAAVARIQRGLGFRSDRSDEIVSALKEAQRLLERGTTLPYFLLQEDESLVFPSGTAGVTLPSRFLREKDGEGPHFTTTENKRLYLEKIDQYTADVRFFDADAGKPIAYVLRKNTIIAYPERDTSYTTTWSYYQGAVSLDNDVENAWLEEEYGAPEVLIGAAGISIAKDLRNAPAVELFTLMFNAAWRGMLGDMFEREAENLPLAMGSKL